VNPNTPDEDASLAPPWSSRGRDTLDVMSAPPRRVSVVRRVGDRVQIEAQEIARFLASPAGRRMRGVLATGIILAAPAIFRVPGLRRYPLIRALEFLGGAALIVRFAEALRDWERNEPITLDLP
jgi:hypothetical protein